MFYLKLAYTNILKNRTVYLPFCLASVFTVVLNVVMQVMLHNEGMNHLPQADSVKSMFGLGGIIIMIFTVLFTFYTHSFLIKRRKKELGLYNILGMDKQNLTKMMFFENVMLLLFILVVGLISGIIFSKLMFLVFKRLTGFGAAFEYSFSLKSIGLILVLFSGIFFFTFLFDMWEVRKSKPIELLNQAKSGEKEPKARWILSVIGIVCLGTGYGISLSIQSPVEALMLFFVAVILVIIGTYSLFIVGSITLLKLLKKRPTIYYKPTNFISISGMIFRMKQNGAGLATICILCTMALVTISTTVCLYVGRQKIIQDRNPFEQSIVSSFSVEQTSKVVEEIAKEKDVKVKNLTFMTSSHTFTMSGDEKSGYTLSEGMLDDYQNITVLRFLALSEYDRIQQTSSQLSNDEVMVYPTSGTFNEQNLKIGSQSFKVKEVINSFALIPYQKEATVKELVVIVSDEWMTPTYLATLIPELNQDEVSLVSEPLTTVNFSLQGSTDQRLAVVKDVRNTIDALLASKDDPYNQFTVSSIDEDQEDLRTLFGGFLFMGIVFGISFLVATTLIIYYKQLSEGNDDRARFDIMQKVGLSHKEVKRTIHQQILLVFFLPITVAILHLSFAFPIIRKLLILFGLVDTNLLILTTSGTVIIFALGYFMIYWQTSKIYYRIVER
ncbi:FtsX-like permease family protein [Enterococcus sp. LJL99]